MREPHKITMTDLSLRISSQMRWKMEGNAGLDLPRYWNSSRTMTGLRSKGLSRMVRKRMSQLLTSALRSRSLFKRWGWSCPLCAARTARPGRCRGGHIRLAGFEALAHGLQNAAWDHLAVILSIIIPQIIIISSITFWEENKLQILSLKLLFLLKYWKGMEEFVILGSIRKGQKQKCYDRGVFHAKEEFMDHCCYCDSSCSSCSMWGVAF